MCVCDSSAGCYLYKMTCEILAAEPCFGASLRNDFFSTRLTRRRGIQECQCKCCHAGGTGKRGRPELTSEQGPPTASVDEPSQAEPKRARFTNAADEAQQQQQQQQQQQGEAAHQDLDMADAEGAAQGEGDAAMGEEDQAAAGAPPHAQQGPPTEFVRFRDDNTAFVRGLPLETKEADLMDFFKQCGAPKSIRMPKNPATGGPRVSVPITRTCTCTPTHMLHVHKQTQHEHTTTHT